MRPGLWRAIALAALAVVLVAGCKRPIVPIPTILGEGPAIAAASAPAASAPAAQSPAREVPDRA